MHTLDWSLYRRIVPSFLDRFWAGLGRDLVGFYKENRGGLVTEPSAWSLFSPVWAIGFCKNQWPKRDCFGTLRFS